MLHTMLTSLRQFLSRRLSLLPLQLLLFLLSLLTGAALMAQKAVKPYGPLPSAKQVQWQEMEFYLFAHFGPNTFTDLEWGKGTELEEVFNPSGLDCRQWCRIAKAA